MVINTECPWVLYHFVLVGNKGDKPKYREYAACNMNRAIKLAEGEEITEILDVKQKRIRKLEIRVEGRLPDGFDDGLGEIPDLDSEFYQQFRLISEQIANKIKSERGSN